MALLGIGKKQEPAEKQEVPEELPDLPAAPENAEAASQPGGEGSVPDELPPVDVPPAELAPDELPPVDGIGSNPAFGGSPEYDKRLYFSSMLQKLNEEGIKSTKLTAPSANLLTDMKKHWKQKKKEAELEEMRRKVTESINPLQKLEQEWVQLQEDIEQKKQQLHEKEEEIRRLAEQAKTVAGKTQRMQAGLK